MKNRVGMNCMRAVAIAALLCLWPASSKLSANLSISPAYVEAKLDKGRSSGEFIISNVGDQEERYRIQSIYFMFSPDGGLVRKAPDQHSLAPWIIFNPKELVMPPKTRRIVRFAITPKAQLSAGEYWAGMELENLNTVTSEGKNDKGVGMKIEVVSKILVPIFGQYGQISYSGEARECKLIEGHNPVTIETTVANTGNARLLVTGKYDLSNSDGQIVETGPMQMCYVLRKSDRKYKITIKAPVPAGHYKFVVEFKSPQLKEPLTQSVQFDWKPAAKP